MPNLLNVMHLVKHYEDVRAVDGITFFIEDGSIFGLLGPNGAGKTTTINILAQVLKPDSGKIELEGKDLFKQPEALKQAIGYVPQDLAIYERLNAIENLQMWGSLYGLTGATLSERIREALELVGLGDAAKRQAHTYSGGMKRRLNIACGLLNHPKLLILDEPAVGVDPQSRNHILESIQRLNSEYGTSVLYTSHYMEEVQQICDRVAIIDHGKIIADNNIEDLIDRFGTGAIVLHFDQNVERAAGLLPDEISAEHVRSDGSRLSISHPHPHRMLPKVLDALHDGDMRASEIEVKRSNLEAVFLNLTGRSLRDE